MALAHFDRSYVWHHPSPFTTFHPKVYIFEGDETGEISVGSNNLTVGGLETNCEAAILAVYDLERERAGWNEALDCWAQLMGDANTVQLNIPVLAQLHESGLLLDETRESIHGTARGTGGLPRMTIFPYTAIRPPSTLPRGLRARRPERRGGAQAGRSPARLPAVRTGTGSPTALIIQIVPHHNGEIFLSKLAINQHPDFFAFPFSGLTVPKRAGNRPYPQRTPDPITEWRIFNKRGKITASLTNFGLNTVYYERKGEIRITIPPERARLITRRSILMMATPTRPSDLDYLCDVFPPGSEQYRSLLPACNETMPAGGQGRPRKFGWL